jgi:hypothetical protein
LNQKHLNRNQPNQKHANRKQQGTETMTTKCKLIQLTLALAFSFALLPVYAAAFDPPRPKDSDLSATGPSVGAKIPGFSARDQHGKQRSFDDIKGPNGALLVFHRSADW